MENSTFKAELLKLAEAVKGIVVDLEKEASVEKTGAQGADAFGMGKVGQPQKEANPLMAFILS